MVAALSKLNGGSTIKTEWWQHYQNWMVAALPKLNGGSTTKTEWWQHYQNWMVAALSKLNGGSTIKTLKAKTMLVQTGEITLS